MGRQSSITTTSNYRLFRSDIDNRELQLKKHRRLKQSLMKYGFLRCFPIVCHRNGAKQLVVKDGQHRLAFAEELGIPVSYIIEEQDFDIAEVNSAGRGWSLTDYADKWAKTGLEDYQEAITFSDTHRVPLGMAFAILSGQQSYSASLSRRVMSGHWEVTDRTFAHKVAATYSGLAAISKTMKNARCLEACIAVSRVEEFDPKRLLGGADRCRDKLASFTTRDAYLDLLEEIYNFGRKHLVALKMPALQALRARSLFKD